MPNILNKKITMPFMGKILVICILSILLGFFGFIITIWIGANYLTYIEIGHMDGYEAYGVIGISIGIVLGAILGGFAVTGGKIFKWSGIFGGILFFIIFVWGPGYGIWPFVRLSLLILPSAFVIFSPGVRLRK